MYPLPLSRATAGLRLRHRLILQGIHPRQTPHRLLIECHGLPALRACCILGIKGGKSGMKGSGRVGHWRSLGQRG